MYLIRKRQTSWNEPVKPKKCVLMLVCMCVQCTQVLSGKEYGDEITLSDYVSYIEISDYVSVASDSLLV